MVELSQYVVLFTCLTVVLEAYKITILSSHKSDQKTLKNAKDDLATGTEREAEKSRHLERRKRASVKQEISFERKQPRCQQKLNKMRESDLPIQLVSMVEEEETVSFTCHYCGDANTKFVSMVWHRLKRDKAWGVYSLVEVDPDMHDDDNLNRVTVGTDHRLTIKKVVKGDAGTYFCRDYSKHDKLLKTHMTSKDIVSLITDKSTFRFLYHFDVLLPSEMKVREISLAPGKHAMSPAKPQTLGNLNLLMDTAWEKWGACSTCGRVGEKKRLGVCYVRKADKDEDSHPWYINAVMMSYPKGVPCRSSLFQGHPEIKPRSDEIEATACKVKCVKGMGIKAGSAKAMSVEGIQTSISFDEKKGGQKNKTRASFAVDEGSTVNLTCSGVPIDWTVVWTNNTRIIEFNVSEARVTIHADNVLQISPVSTWDAATYLCLSRGEIKVKVKLTVVPSLKMDAATWLYAYFTSLTYPADLFLFLILMIIKHRHRRAGRRLNKAELLEIESFSSRASHPGSSESGSRRHSFSKRDRRNTPVNSKDLSSSSTSESSHTYG